MKFYTTLIFSLLAIASYGQTKSTKVSPALASASPASVGVSQERLNRIDAMISRAVSDDVIPGAVALIARNGKIVLHKAYGMADIDTKRKMKTNDIFRIASQTKAITATAVMMLWEEGKFQLDDPISKYIPEFKNAIILDSLIEVDSSFIGTPAKNPITIRHLITHTSGIGYGFIDSDKRFTKMYAKAGIIDGFSTKDVKIGDNIKKLAEMPLHHEPGKRFTYSEGYDVLGYFVELMSGMPFDKFLRTRIFDPLKMNDTWFYLPKSIDSRLVSVYEKVDGKWSGLKPSINFNPNYPKIGARKFFSGGAGLSSTAYDYATFLQMYLNGGELNGVRLLSRTTVQVILSNQIGEIWGDSGAYYGLAFMVTDDIGQAKGGQGSSGTFSWGGYFNTSYFADPKEQIIGIIMKQTSGNIGDYTGWKFRQMVGQTIDD